MIQIRPRWPILAAIAAAITYGANHYQLAGLEHLRLEARNANNLPTAGSDHAEISGSSWDSGPHGMSFGQPAIQTHSDWREQLSVGEKLAMWQHSRENTTLTPIAGSGLLPSTQAGAALPSSTPIPVPPGFAQSSEKLHSSGFSELLPPALLEPLETDVSSGKDGSVANLTSLPVAAEPSVAQNSAASPRSIPATNGLPLNSGPNDSRSPQSVRLATFNVCSLGLEKVSMPPISEILTSIIRQFDVVAIQEIQSSRDDLLPTIIRKLNETGRRFDYLIGPRVGRVAPQQQFAFVFDTERVETDRYELYTVDDPHDLVNYEPLVAWFRCKGVPPGKAFTFTMVNMQVDANFFDAEIQLLPKLIEGIQNDGRNEDDWILAGDFSGPIPILPGWDGTGSLRRALSENASTVAGGKSLDNLLFSTRSTVEFTGQAAVFDFLRHHNLSLENALEVSDHLPVWADFSVYEGSHPGLIAPLGTTSH